jgi:hypothetical protein
LEGGHAVNFVLALVGLVVGFGVSLALTFPLMALEKAINGSEYNKVSFLFATLQTLLTRSLGFLGAAIVYSMRDTYLPVSFVVFIGICGLVNDIARINKLSGLPDVLSEKGYCLGGLLALVVAQSWLVGIRVL